MLMQEAPLIVGLSPEAKNTLLTIVAQVNKAWRDRLRRAEARCGDCGEDLFGRAVPCQWCKPIREILKDTEYVET